MKCCDCAKFQKYHKIVTKTGWSNTACMNEHKVHNHIPAEQRKKYTIEYLKLIAQDDICDQFIEDNK
jgi:translation initiation factor IF-1